MNSIDRSKSSILEIVPQLKEEITKKKKKNNKNNRNQSKAYTLENKLSSPVQRSVSDNVTPQHYVKAH